MDAHFAADRVSALRRLYRINITDDVGNRDVGSCQFLDVPLCAASILDRRPVALFLDKIAATPADRAEGVIVDLATCDDRDHFVEKIDETAQYPALRLAAETQQDHIVAGQQRIDDLRDDGFLIPDDSRKDRLFQL